MIKTGKRKLLKKEKARDFADGPVVKTLCSWCRGQGQGTRSLMLQLKKIPHAAAKIAEPNKKQNRTTSQVNIT